MKLQVAEIWAFAAAYMAFGTAKEIPAGENFFSGQIAQFKEERSWSKDL
jgi:hypothetical protein